MSLKPSVFVFIHFLVFNLSVNPNLMPYGRKGHVRPAIMKFAAVHM